jgi:S-layer homology domain
MSTLIACLTIAMGQGAVKPIPAWIPEFENEMRAAGLFVGYPEGMWEPRPPTRYEYAVAAHAAYSNIKDKMPAILAKEKVEGRVEKWWRQIDGLVDMFVTLRPELRSMGVDDAMDKQIIKELRSNQSKLAQIGAGGNNSPAWVESSMVELKRAGLLVGYPDSLHNLRPPTRYEWAVATHATFMHLTNMLGDPETLNEPPSSFARWPECVDDLSKLFVEFRQELTAMQVYETISPAALKNQLERHRAFVAKLAGYRPPFPDVPAGHWATGAIGALKKEGLIRGYPGGRFGGKS